jgi:hypothetical protein
MSQDKEKAPELGGEGSVLKEASPAKATGTASTNSAKNASENHDDRPDYSDRHHGQDETPVDDSKSLLVDPLEKRLQPFYGVDGCGHIADWDNEAALIGCAFLDPVLVMSALENVGLENPVDLFGDKRHRIVFRIAREICNRGGALDLITFSAALKTEEQAGREKPGIVSYNYISALIEKVPSPGNYSYYLSTVLDRYKARRKRQLMQRQYTLENENPNGPGDVNESIDDAIAELEKIRSVGPQKKKAINFASWNDVTNYKVPEGFQLMDNMFLARGQISVVAGYPGTGKSMFSMWLAALAATGAEDFMGHKILTRFRTLVLQNENGLFPLQQRFQGVQERFPDFNFNDWIKVSEPPENGLAVSDPEFRRAVKNEIRSFDPGLVVIDPFTNLVNDLGHRDYKEALDHIRDIIPERPDQPAILIVAHCRKRGQGSKRVRGRGLLNEIIGSQVLGGQLRAAWGIDAVSDNVEDERVIVQDIKNNNGPMIGPSAWQRGVGCFDEIPDFDMDEYYSDEGGNGGSGNTKDDKAWRILSDISNGDPTGFNKWHEACKAEGVYKGKASFNEAVKRLKQSNRIQQDAASKLYQIVMEDGAFSDD